MGKGGNKYLYQTVVSEDGKVIIVHRPITSRRNGDLQYKSVITRLINDGLVKNTEYETEGTEREFPTATVIATAYLGPQDVEVRLLQWLERKA